MTKDRWSTWIGIAVVAAIAAWIVYDRQGGLYAPSRDRASDHAVPARVIACRSLSGPTEDRLRACLDELDGRGLSATTRAASTEVPGALVVVGGAPGDARTPDDALTALLLGTDEEALADALRAGGVAAIAVHRSLQGALDRDRRVLARLVHHDHLEWLQLRHASAEHLVYQVRRSPMRLDVEVGEALVAGLRARLADAPPGPQPWRPAEIRLMASIRLQGRALVLRHASGTNVEAVLDDLARKLRDRWERDVEPDGHGTLAERLDDARIEVHVVLERATIEPRSPAEIDDLFEPGVDGMMLRDREGADEEHFTYFPGSELVAREHKTVDAFLRDAAATFEWRDERPWEDTRRRFESIRGPHFLEAHPGGGEVVAMMRGAPIVAMSELTDASIRQMLLDGGEWWLRNQNPDGSILYKYWPTQNRRSTEYNEVRHILATRDLADSYRWRRDARYLEGSRKAMDWLLRYEVRDTDAPHALLPHPPAGTSLFRYRENQKLGTVAVGLLGWIAWAEASGRHDEDDRIRRMARFVLHMLEPSGKFAPYYVQPGHSYYGQTNDIVPGEAALALGEVAEYFDEDDWLAFMPKYLDYYEPWWRERAVRQQPTGRWPHHTYDNQTRLDLVQFGPWTVMAAKQYWLLTGDERAARFGLEIADWMIDSYQWSGERSPWPDYVGGYYKMPTELPAMQTFCYSEGTAAAYHIAARFAPERKDKYEVATREALRFLRVMQYDDVDSYMAPRVEVVHGGVKYAMNEGKVRIDYVGHGLSTVSQYLDARAFDPAAGLSITPLEADDPTFVPYRSVRAFDAASQASTDESAASELPAEAEESNE